MKKLLLIAGAMLLVSGGHASAAAWTDSVQAAIKNGNFSQIDVIAAKNPQDEGDIAIYLLQQSQNTALTQDTRVKLFAAALPLGSQIPLSDANEAAGIIADMLALASDPAWQKAHPHEAAQVFAAALGLTSQENIITANPNLHNLAVADADDFSTNNPGAVDKELKDQVDLALQIGLPPPLGPRGIINPSGE